MRSNLFALGKLGMACAAVLAATAASAAPVTNWDYSVSSQFRTPMGSQSGSGTGFTAGDGVTEFVPSGTSGAGTAASANSAWSISALELNWGRTTGSIGAGTRSGLGITAATPTDPTGTAVAGNTTGIVQTNGAFEAANAYTHYNRGDIGRDSWTLRNTVIDASLSLTPDDGGGTLPAFVANYQISFVETPNRAADCPTASTDANVCSDIFILSGLLGESFLYNGYEYSFDFGATGFGTLLDAQCALAGVANGCVGFTTPEGQNYTSQFSFALRAQEVPEPASIALLGLGLLGMAGLRSRKQKNKA